MSLPPLLRCGTSTWAYEGWQGLVYHRSYPKSRFKKDCLAEYARYAYRGERLFRTVGLDQTFYRPPTTAQLAHYAGQLPPGFEVCSKVWEEVTIPRFADQARYGAKAGRDNPRFLDAALFRDQVVAPYAEAFEPFTGPFILEFQRTGIEPEDFLTRLDGFLGALPRDFRYAVEVRNPRILGSRYAEILRAHAVAHVYNHWTYMPALAEQHSRLDGTFTAPFVLLRLLTPLRMKYEDAVAMAEPYDRIVRALPAMRKDTAGLVGQAMRENRRAYVLVNNRAEGCAPLTVQAIVDQFLPPGGPPGPSPAPRS